jgi:hypothetical protein
MFGSRNQVVKVLVKAMVCLAFIGIFVTKSYAQLGGPPNFAVQPLGLSVLNGGTAVITTTATSLTGMSLTWYLNGKKLNNNKVSVLNVVVPLVGTVSTLTILGIDTNLAGTYSVMAKNSAGTVMSSNATVIVVSSVVSNIVSTVTNTVNFVSSTLKMTTSGLQLQLSVPVGSNVVIHASSDLMHWTPISTNSSSTGTLTFTDTNALHVTSRFYRAVIQ